MKNYLLFTLAIITSFTFLNAQNQSVQMNNNLPEAYSKKKVEKKNPYICEVHFEDGTYQELDKLEDFIGEYHQVKKIILMYMDLSDLPAVLNKFKMIELLDLSHNKLEALDPTFFKSYKHLKELYINENLMTDKEIEAIDMQLKNVKVFNRQ